MRLQMPELEGFGPRHLPASLPRRPWLGDVQIVACALALVYEMGKERS